MLLVSRIVMLSEAGGSWNISGPRRCGSGMAHIQQDLELFDAGNFKTAATFSILSSSALREHFSLHS